MNNYQDILESYDKIYNLTVIYAGEEIKHVYKNVYVTYTDAGIPYIEMYPGDQIKIDKMVFINTKEVFGEFINKKDFSLNDEEQNVGLTFKSSTNIIIAVKPGTYEIESNKFGTLDVSKYNINNVSDPNIIIVVKEIPEIKEIMWGYDSNPLLVSIKDDKTESEIQIKLKAKYSDNSIKDIDSFDFIYNNFNITSNNICLVKILNVYKSGAIITDMKMIITPYKDQATISIKLTESSLLKNVILPKDLQLISYKDEFDIDKIKQSVYYIYFLSDTLQETDMVTDKQYYIEKNKPKTFYVKVLNGYFDHGRFEVTDCKNISPYVLLSTDSKDIIIDRNAYNNAFLIKGINEVNNPIIKLTSSSQMPQSNNVEFNDISVIDSIKKLTWKINNKVITEINNGTIASHVNTIDLNVTNLHNILLNEVICETLSGKIINIESDCVFSSTKKDSLDINENITIEDNKMTVIKSNECKIIFNGSTKYNLPSILETSNSVIANIVMTKEDIFCSKIEVYEKNDSDMNLLNDKELELKMLSEKSLYAIVYPDNATYKEVNWFSDDTSVATIDKDGNLKIVNAGSANIICTIKYPEPDNPEQPDKANDKNDKEYYNPNTGVVEPLGFNPPDISAIININAIKVDVSEISFDRNSMTLYVDGDHQAYYVRVKPEGASITDVKVKFESDDKNNNFFGIDSNDEMYVRKAGTGKLIAYSVDDPSITAEMQIIGIDTTVKKVTIDTSPNDTDYEYYDHMNERKTFTTDGEFVSTGERVTNEKYDDDDFNRYYLPVNNSMQLSASVEPANAINTNIKWLSSNSSLVKVNDKGIITAIREGEQELDVYGNDDISESRFANTVWITAINPKYNKYDVCQVRVTRNKTIAIDIPFTTEHDYDVDDILPDGTYDRNAEHEFDYVMYVGDTISIPITLSTQDSNFGTSDYLSWFYDMKGEHIIELSKGSPDHSNTEDSFDWTTTSPGAVNSNKNSFNLNVKAIGIGDTYFYAVTEDNVRGLGSNQLYVPAEAFVTEVSKHPGITNLDTPYGSFSINVYYFSKKCLALYNIKRQYREKLNQILEANFSGEGEVTTTINGVSITIWKNGVNLVDEALDSVIDEGYIAKNGVALVGAKCMLHPNGTLKIIVPETCHIDNLKTKGENSVPLSFDFIPTIDKNAITVIDEDGNEMLDTSKVSEYISINVYHINDELKNMPIFLDGIYKDKDENLKRQVYMMEYKPWKDETNTVNKYVVSAYFPSPNKTGDIVLDSGDPFNARPGTGIWVKGPKSRKVTVRVVAAPSKLKIGWINAYNDELLNINVISNNSITRNKWGDEKYHYMAIGTDDEFKELLKNAETWGGTLAEKYKSFAWFSDNEKVIRFEDVEDLSYKDTNDEYTNNPNESYKETKEETKTIYFNNINASDFTGYVTAGDNCEIKFSDDYKYSKQEDLYVNNKNLCIIKITAPGNGRIVINHSGSIQYANNEAFTNAKPLTIKSGYGNSSINVNRKDVIYIKGEKDIIVYIKKLIFDDGLYFHNLYNKDIVKEPSEYVQYTSNVYIKLPDDKSRSYITSNGIKLYDETTTIKYIPKYKGTVIFTFSGGNGIKIYNKSLGTKQVGSSMSPYTLKVEPNQEYIISGNSGVGTVISKLEYINTLDSGIPGGYKGTLHYTLKSSFMKRVICKDSGTANIYVLSPKGQALVKKTIYIK